MAGNESAPNNEKHIKIFFISILLLNKGSIFVKKVKTPQTKNAQVNNIYAFFFCRILEVKLDRV